jgi:Fe-S cluster biogenesis protein NfuA
MEKVKVGSSNDMDGESVGSSGGACFGCGRRGSGTVTLKQRRTELVKAYLVPCSLSEVRKVREFD